MVGFLQQKRSGVCTRISPILTPARKCLELGSALVAPRNTYEDEFIRDVLVSRMDYALPIRPGFFHIGVYQNQKENQMYIMSGRQL